MLSSFREFGYAFSRWIGGSGVVLTDENPTTLPYETPPPPALKAQATRGAFWLVLQALLAKGVAALGNLALAWLLMPEDFGLIAMAYTVTAFTSLLQSAGLREVLVQRHKRFELWATPGFWMAVTLGLAMGLATLIAAPIAARVYGDPRLQGLLMLLAAGAPIISLSMVPSARLQNQMRFRTSAALGLVDSVLFVALTVLFAWMGYRAYSFVIARLIVVVITSSAMWMLAGVRIHPRPHLRRWRFLIGDTTSLFLTSAAATVVSQADYMMLGRLRGTQELGIYFFAFTLSTQALNILTNSLTHVLFPALSKLQDEPERQVRAYLSAAQVLATVGIPLCILQAALAEPAMKLLVGPEWSRSIPVLQVLSIAMCIQLIGATGGSLLKAQGRFMTQLRLAGLGAAVFVAIMWMSAALGGAVSVAWGVLIGYAAIWPIQMREAIRPGGAGWKQVLGIFFVPVMSSAAAAVAGVALAMLTPLFPLRELAQIGVITCVFSGIYLALVHRIDQQRLQDVLALLLRR